MDFLSNGFHQLYSELELEDEHFSCNEILSDYNERSSLMSSETVNYLLPPSLSPSSCTIFDNYAESISPPPPPPPLEFENILLTNDCGRTFESFQNDLENNVDYFNICYTSDQCVNIDSWETNLLENFVELPELTDFLPERTPLCSDSCNSVLKESSDNLNKFRSTITNGNNSGSDDLIQQQNTQNNLELITSDHNISRAPRTKSSSLCKIEKQSDIDETGEKITFPCTFGNCTKVYAKPAHLKAHLRRHLGDKPYVCSWPNCTWKFSRSDELARHKRSHSGIKPYECCYCTKCFARSDHLAKHRKVHERKIAANKLKGILTPGATINHVIRPGRRPKNMNY